MYDKLHHLWKTKTESIILYAVKNELSSLSLFVEGIIF